MTKIHGLNIVILLIWAALTCGGLGNAAYKYDGIYWVPFVVNLIIFLVLFLKELKAMDKVVSTPGTGSGAALPAQGENEKVDNITDKPRDRKTGRYIKSDGGKAK